MNRLRALLVACLVAAAAPSAPGQDLLIRGGRLFDSVSDELRPNAGILVTGGRIAAIDIEPARHPDGLAVLVLDDGDVVMPGIFDLHAHYNINVMDRGRHDETRHYSVVFLANGVTSTFPAGEYDPEEMLEMRRRIGGGDQIGPRVYGSGPYVGLGMRRRAGADEVVEQVDTWAALGARGFKAKAASPEQLRALIERAHYHGLPVTAHLDSGFRNSVNPRDAILMGIDRVEHFLGGDLLPPERSAYASLQNLTDEDLDSQAFRDICRLFVERGVAFDATLTAYGYFADPDDDVFEHWTDEGRFLAPDIRAWAEGREQQVIEQFAKIYRVKLKSVKRFFDAGGTITLGTDHVSTGEYLGGFAAHREMHAMSKAGIPNAAVLRIATINGARAMNVGDRLGTIEVGKDADMIVIAGDPLADIRVTRTVHTVVLAGRVHRTSELLDSVVDRVGGAESSVEEQAAGSSERK